MISGGTRRRRKGDGKTTEPSAQVVSRREDLPERVRVIVQFLGARRELVGLQDEPDHRLAPPSGSANTSRPLPELGRRIVGASSGAISVDQLPPPIPAGTATYCFPFAA